MMWRLWGDRGRKNNGVATTIKGGEVNFAKEEGEDYRPRNR